MKEKVLLKASDFSFSVLKVGNDKTIIDLRNAIVKRNKEKGLKPSYRLFIIDNKDISLDSIV